METETTGTLQMEATGTLEMEGAGTLETEGTGTLEMEGTGTLELMLTDVKGLSIITERRSLLSSLQAWKLSVKMQISVGMKNCLWGKEIQIKRQKKDG